jgi:hypothetical protein
LKNYLIVIFSFLWFLSSGQNRPQMLGGSENQEEAEPAKKAVKAHVKAWQIREYGIFTDSVKIDTLLSNFHSYNPVLKNNITATYTGNYGGASIDNDFSKRSDATGFYFFRTHDAWLLTPSSLNHYNTTTPYTLLDYSQSENKNKFNETRFNILHSQNVNRYLNLTFRYDQAKSQGQYKYQENKNHFITLYSSYNRDKLSVYGGFIFNRIYNQESGGIVNDDDLLTTDPEWIVPNLTDAYSTYRNSTYFVDTEYRLGLEDKSDDEAKTIFIPVAGFLYSLRISANTRLFNEGSDIDNTAFFKNSWLNQKYSDDSVRYNVITNLFQVKFYESIRRKFSFGKRAFAGIEMVGTSMEAPGYDQPVFPFHPGEFAGNFYTGPSSRRYSQNYSNAFFGGGIFRESGKFWTWNFDGKQYFSGIKGGQTEINGIISKPVRFRKDSLANIRISGNLWNHVPDYFQQHYFSNRVKWENDFSNEQIMNASFMFTSPRNMLETGARYSLINNFIYHDTLGIPAQTKTELLILSAWLSKELKWKHFSLQTQILWQKTSAPRYIHLPELSARSVFRFDFILSKVLFIQMGSDIRYNTAYYADAYQPATGFFYLQNNKKLGNYPYIDLFANLKLKRTRVFFQYLNAGSLFLERNYFTALHHPMNKATFRLGVSWSFYD